MKFLTGSKVTANLKAEHKKANQQTKTQGKNNMPHDHRSCGHKNAHKVKPVLSKLHHWNVLEIINQVKRFCFMKVKRCAENCSGNFFALFSTCSMNLQKKIA